MISFDKISKRLIFVDTLCKFFVKVIKTSVFCFLVFFIYSLIANNKNYIVIDNNIDTTIIKPVVKTLEDKNGYVMYSDVGVFVNNGLYKFKNVKIVNDNIEVFAKELDFYGNNNEILLKDRPVVVFNNSVKE